MFKELRELRVLRGFLFFALLSSLSLGAYLLASRLFYRTGFPLDDAWIHQTYARNLALLGEWSFIPGQPSAGSTAPLWSGLLAAGHLLRLGPYVWTYLLGWALMLALALLGARAFQAFSPARGAWAAWAGILLVFEWHLVWAAASGMETLLFALLVLLALAWIAAGWRRWLGLGMLVGFNAWVRPDGITLLGPALLALALVEAGWRARLRAAGLLFLGFAALFVPYLVFNRLLAGSWWPNTFYAKQAEYAVLRQAPFWSRLSGQIRPLLQGAGAVLLPGVLLFAWNAFRRRAWGALAGVIWLMGYLGLYAWRLPVAYQHGRYLIPVMPVFLVWGLAGLEGWVQPSTSVMWRRVVGKAWSISAALVLFLYWLLGARAYSGDVAFIESEMVATARWVAENTDPEALVAAHDIGALGYFGGRRLLDLAGLVSPQVIPFIRNEPRLVAFLDEQEADYLVTFPGWYPELVRRAPALVYTTGGEYAPALGGENMAVYRWPGEP